MIYRTLLLVLISTFCATAQGQSQPESSGKGRVYLQGPKSKDDKPLYYEEKDGRFIERSREGWFFYEDPLEEDLRRRLEEAKKKEKEEPKKEDSKQEKKEEKKQLAEIPKDPGPIPLSSAWIKENIEIYLQRAMDEPSEENVRAYLYLQRLALDKSSNFAKTFQQVSKSDPFLSEKDRGPIMAVDRSVRNKAIGKKSEEIKNWVKSSMQLVFFYKSDCPYCIQMSPLMAQYRQEGYSISVVSLDQKPLPNFPDFIVDRGQAKKMGIEITPTLMIYSPEAEKKKISGSTPFGEKLPAGWMIWSAGYASFSDLDSTLNGALYSSGFLKEDWYKETKLFKDSTMNLPVKEENRAKLESVVNDKEKFVQYMRSQLGGRVTSKGASSASLGTPISQQGK